MVDAGPDASGTIPSGPITLECATGALGCAAGVGRRPAGLVVKKSAARDGVGAWLAEVAHLEAASVHAFRRLASELETMGAPAALVRAARRAAHDEVRHARSMSGLARRRGVRPAAVTLAPTPTARSLTEFAIENAVEGCVRECFGALVATRQSRCAQDPAFARQMARIARDETRHAALAYRIARWLSPRLDASARARLRQATADALTSLRREVASVPANLAIELGLPSGAEGAKLVDAFAQSVLAA
jgi:hypothetical protein